jgi:RimJ/RimL family protein N-acetyltransferase
MGASIIEKHFCLSREIENPDSSFSMEPEEFAQMVTDIRQAEKARGIVSYGVTEQEKSNHIFRKSIFVTKAVKAGEIFTEENVRVIRPGFGLHPREFVNVLGKVALQDIERGMPLKASYVKEYLELRPANLQDCELVFGWANDAENRKWSFTTESIPWETHQKWYKESLERKDRELLICYRMGTPIGQLRLDISGKEAVLSYSIAKEYRNRGYGAELLRVGEAWVRLEKPDIKCLIADTKPENQASGSILVENGYVKEAKEGFVRYTKRLD